MKNKINKLKSGVTVYIVHALNKSSCVDKHRLTSKPYKNGVTDSLFVNVSDLYGAFSLQDVGVIPNEYNNHKLFFSRRRAESYLKLCLNGTVKTMQRYFM